MTLERANNGTISLVTLVPFSSQIPYVHMGSTLAFKTYVDQYETVRQHISRKLPTLLSFKNM